MQSITCCYCGNTNKEYLVKEGDLINCQCCNVTFEYESAALIYDKLLSKLNEEKLEKLQVNLKNLYDAITENFPSKKSIINYATIVKSIDSENILANLYEILINQNYRLSNYLNEIINQVTDSEKEFIAKQVITNLDSRDQVAINNFIDSIKDKSVKEKLFTQLEIEIDKLDEGTYNCFIQRDVFIAHSSKDSKLAIELVEYLEDHGYTCFISSRNLKHGINASSEYLTNLKTAIDNCTCFLMINTLNSRHAGCDVLKVEIPAVKELEKKNAPVEYRLGDSNKIPIKYKKKRINYLVDDYTYRDGHMIPLDKMVKEFFDGFEYCNSFEKIESLIVDYKFNNVIIEEEVSSNKQNIPFGSHTNIDNLFKKVKFEISEKEFGLADATLDRIAEIDIENSELWLYRLLVETKSINSDDLSNKAFDWTESSNYRNAIRFTNIEQKRELEKAIESAKKNYLEAQQEEKDRVERLKLKQITEEKRKQEQKIKDEQERIKNIELERKKSIQTIVIEIKSGKTRNLKFGNYSWRVLEVKDSKALILSEQIIETRKYHEEYNAITFEQCTLRKYLNTEFIKKFKDYEQAKILPVTNVNKNNKWYGTKAGKATNDLIFLLSIEEVVKYFGDSRKLLKNHKPNSYIDDQYNSNRRADYQAQPSQWWLRSLGNNKYFAAFINNAGHINIAGHIISNNKLGIRPALWLDLKEEG